MIQSLAVVVALVSGAVLGIAAGLAGISARPHVDPLTTAKTIVLRRKAALTSLTLIAVMALAALSLSLVLLSKT